jgi:hypothetical protein
MEFSLIQDAPMITTIAEWCPICKCQRGILEIHDAPHEDCNLWDAVKEYKIVQKTVDARTCDCGTPLIPHMEGYCPSPIHPLKRRKLRGS